MWVKPQDKIQILYKMRNKARMKMVKEEALKKRTNVPQDVNLLAPHSPLLKLKIRNTTKYLNWRLSILKRDNFTCKICHASIKENKNLRLEVHHPKAFDDICKENNVTTVEQALECELWSMNNGSSICYRCHKDVEKLRTNLRNMFWLKDRNFLH
jgi:formamidopyrimidine-DNA glycosylase